MNIENLYNLFTNSTGISTDTRSIKTGNLFIALSGDNFNGNKFAEQAINNGAAHAIIDDINYHIPGHTTVVSNTLKTLQELANYHRQQLNIPIIALTGSNGKTTTKELINTVLTQQYTTTATIGNLNNHIGVPLTLLSMTQETEIGVVEMGANNFGEIALLSDITQPDYGYITNFGKAHLEGFGSLEGVVKAKSELYEYLRNHEKKAFVNIDNPKQIKQSEGIDCHSFSETEDSNTVVKFVEAKPYVNVAYKNHIIKSKLIGDYNFTNIAAAIAIGEQFKITTENICKAIEQYTPNNNRSQIIEKDTNKIILDAYNANPTSMKAALENFNQLNTTKKALFIGDMFELGSTSLEEHQNIVNFIESTNIQDSYIIGEHFCNTKHASHIKSYKDFKALQDGFTNKLTNYTILIKGSRGMALERILDLL
ncbi:MAG: UDP-N-acetylmuramoyl-tripeptide--D-alanyl-D-alanine ligase [Flavobacteriaceae bacterium]